MHLAIQSEYGESLLPLFLLHHVDLEIRNKNGLTPMGLAIDKGINVFSIHLRSDSIKQWTHVNEPHLLVSSISGDERSVKLLMERGALIPEKAIIKAASKG